MDIDSHIGAAGFVVIVVGEEGGGIVPELPVRGCRRRRSSLHRLHDEPLLETDLRRLARGYRSERGPLRRSWPAARRSTLVAGEQSQERGSSSKPNRFPKPRPKSCRDVGTGRRWTGRPAHRGTGNPDGRSRPDLPPDPLSRAAVFSGHAATRSDSGRGPTAVEPDGSTRLSWGPAMHIDDERCTPSPRKF
jgi:hypothetical protein